MANAIVKNNEVQNTYAKRKLREGSYTQLSLNWYTNTLYFNTKQIVVDFTSNSPKKRKLTMPFNEKNPISILNELRAGLKYNLLEQSGPAHAPIFTVSVTVDGHPYVGVGGSKKVAKLRAAEAALKSFIQFPSNYSILNGFTNSNSNNEDFTIDSFDDILPNNNTFNSNETVTVPKSALMLLNELFPKARFSCEENDDVYARFKVTVTIGEEKFSGTGMFVGNFIIK